MKNSCNETIYSFLLAEHVLFLQKESLLTKLLNKQIVSFDSLFYQIKESFLGEKVMNEHFWDSEELKNIRKLLCENHNFLSFWKKENHDSFEKFYHALLSVMRQNTQDVYPMMEELNVWLKQFDFTITEELIPCIECVGRKNIPLYSLFLLEERGMVGMEEEGFYYICNTQTEESKGIQCTKIDIPGCIQEIYTLSQYDQKDKVFGYEWIDGIENKNMTFTFLGTPDHISQFIIQVQSPDWDLLCYFEEHRNPVLAVHKAPQDCTQTLDPQLLYRDLVKAVEDNIDLTTPMGSFLQEQLDITPYVKKKVV